jgi:hypothetical protein
MTTDTPMPDSAPPVERFVHTIVITEAELIERTPMQRLHLIDAKLEEARQALVDALQEHRHV